MKKLVQLTAILSLVFVFSAISAYAQSAAVKQYDAKIPFDFNIGQKSYQAGNYVVRIEKLATNGAILSLVDDNNKRLQSVMVFLNGSVSEKDSQLLFNIYGEQRYLAGVTTPELAISLGKSKVEKMLNASNVQAKPSTVAIHSTDSSAGAQN